VFVCSWFILRICFDRIPKLLRGRHQSIVYDCLRFLQDAAQIIRSSEALRIDLPAKHRGDAIDHLAANHRLADRRFRAPLRSVLEEIEDGDRKVMVRRQQPCAPGDDSVPVIFFGPGFRLSAVAAGGKGFGRGRVDRVRSDADPAF
jgi:hypothetical protein